MSSVKIAFDDPRLLGLLIPCFLIILIPFFRLPSRRRRTAKKILPVILHLMIVLLLVLILSGISVIYTSDEQAALILVDLSDSTRNVREEIVARTEELLKQMDDSASTGVILFGGDQLYAAKLEDNERTFTVQEVEADATDIGSALEYAASLLPDDKAGHIILMTDGSETEENAETAARFLAAKGIRVDAVYFDSGASLGNEIQIEQFTAPEGAYVGDEITFGIELKSNVSEEVVLNLYDNGSLAVTEEAEAEEGSTQLTLSAKAEDAGLHTYYLELSAAADTIRENNTAYASVEVTGEPTVLIIADTIGNAEALAGILSDENEVSTVTEKNAPRTITELCDYDEVILLNVDAEALPDGYDQLLEDYVGVYGRSLLAVGGQDTFMYGNMEGTALEEMLPVSFTLNEESEGDSVALMLVLDCSSSMSRTSTYLSVAKQGAIKCVEAMSGNDYVGIVSFNSRANLESELIQATDSNKDSLTRIISGLNTSQGTYYTEALKLAHEELLKSDAAVKHIIFLSDGQPNDSGYMDAVRSAAEDGISVSTIGLGYSSSILESMAESADGRYYYVESSKDLPDIMLSETEQVTVSSLITGEFIPVVSEESELTDFLGEEELPVLTGYLGTTLREDATAFITAEEGNPIYASWKYGEGTAACFTSDLSGVWSSEWLSSQTGQEIIRRMVSVTEAEIHNDSSLTAQVLAEGSTADVSVTSSNTGSILEMTVSYDGKSETCQMTEDEPGVYTAGFQTEAAGIYEILVTESDGDGNVLDYLITAFPFSYSREYDAFAGSGAALLSGICDTTDGQIYTDIAQLAKARVSSTELIYDPLTILTVLSLVLMLADIAVRKIRWRDIRNYFLIFKFRAGRKP